MEMKTNCGKCVFYKGKDGCELNRYEAFEKNGAVVDKSEGTTTIKGRFCSAYRTEPWLKGKDKFNLPIIVRAELLISTEVLIYLDSENYNEDKLEATLDNITNQLLKPNNVVIIVNKDGVNIAKLMNIAKKYKINYRIDRMLPEDGKRFHCLDAIDISVKKTESDYYLVMEPGGFLEDDEFFANIDEALNERLERFSVLLPNQNGRGAFVSTALHKKLNGNAAMSEYFLNEGTSGSETLIFRSLEEKVNYLAQKDNHYYLIKKYEEINGNQS